MQRRAGAGLGALLTVRELQAAQELQKILPDAVHSGPDGVLGVDYNSITGVLMSATREMALKIKELEGLIS